MDARPEAAREIPVTMRLAASADIGALKHLRLQMLLEWADKIPEQLPDLIQAYLEKHIPDGSCLCALLELHGEIVAMAMLCTYDELPDEANITGKGAKLCSVYTLPSFRGRGYMEKLLLFLLVEAKKKGIREITAAAERKAVPLYKKVGFQMAETILFMDLQPPV